MSNSKKILSVLLALILAFGSIAITPLSVSAAEAETAPTGATVDEAYPDFEYIIHCDTLDDGTAEITQYMGEGGDITIPSSLGGYTVTSIGWAGFRDCTYLTSVTIPDSVTSISDSAFRGCTGLTSIDIPDSVTSIGSSTFYGCTGLTSIDIHDSVTFIGDWAFGYCTSLTSIDIPDSVKWIGSDAFYGCTGLTSVTIGNSVTSIDDFAFGYYFDDTQHKVDDFIIYGYSGSEAEHYANDNGFTFVPIRPSSPDEATPDEATPDDATPDESTPDESTPDEAVPMSGTTGDCTWSLDNGVLTISGNGKMGDYSYDYINGTYVTTAPWGDKSFNTVVIENGVRSIGDSAFAYCTGFTSVAIPNSVTSIGVDAFCRCTGLTSVTIPDSVTSIETNAWEAASTFSGCTSLVSVKIGNSITSIGNNMFSNCASLTGIDIPDSVTRIGNAGFYGCTGLTSIDIPDSVTSIGNTAFYGCTGLKSVTIPDSVKRIGFEVFYGCIGLPSITIPNSVTSIGNDAFGYYRDDDRNKLKIDGFTIYGYEGSEAEKYAKDNEFTFVPLKAKADEATGIILDIPEDTDLTVKDITAEIVCDLPDGCNKKTAYDITLTKDGESVQPENTVTVKIPCTNENAKAYRLESDGKMTDMKSKYKDGYIVFTTDHFSVYVLVEPKTAGVTVSGAITSYVDDSDVTVKLTGADNNFTAEVKGKSDYSIEAVPAGEYTLTVSKDNHITREYNVTVADADVTQDVKVCPKGDVNGDGETDIMDCSVAQRYIRELTTLDAYQIACGDVSGEGDGETDIMDCSVAQRYIRELTTLDAYQIACGDVSGEGDGELDIQDVSRILRHIRELAMLY